jgi:hypothetical protein
MGHIIKARNAGTTSPHQVRMNVVVHSLSGEQVGIFENMSFKKAMEILYQMSLRGFDDFKPTELAYICVPLERVV